MMQEKSLSDLSRRERQIMDIFFELKEASAHDVLSKLPDPPSYSTVRALIARLVEKKLVTFRIMGTKHIYSPLMTEKKAQSSALLRLLKTFFKGSKTQAVTALLELDSESMSAHEIEDIERTIERIKAAKEKSS